MNVLTPAAEKQLWQRLQKGDEPAFRRLFDSYYKYLTVIAFRYIGDSEKAKDMAQETFVELWNRKDTLELTSGLKAYLRRAVINKCLNYLKREKRLDFSAHSELPDAGMAPEAQDRMEAADMQQLIQNTIDQLPDRCRVIFCMSRFEEKSHKEIAQLLDISTKTIETQMTRALKRLREAIQRHGLAGWWILYFFWFHL